MRGVSGGIWGRKYFVIGYRVFGFRRNLEREKGKFFYIGLRRGGKVIWVLLSIYND